MSYQFDSIQMPSRDQLETTSDNQLVVPVEMGLKEANSGAESVVTVRVTVPDSGSEDQIHAEAVHTVEEVLSVASQHLEENDARNLSWFVQGE